MPNTSRRSGHRHESGFVWSSAVLIILLLCKFFWTLAAYRVPLGFDVGLYRYLFLRHATGFPPFVMAPMETWAQGHPLGLFFFSTTALRLGVPVAALLGWIWNVFPVLLAVLLAWVMGKREGRAVGVLVLLAALLSLAYFDGFALMYWKTYASLAWCVLTYHLLERRSWFAIVTGMLTVATHHQTGLLFGLVFLTWALHEAVPALKARRFDTQSCMPLIVGGTVLVLGLLTYIPVWHGAVVLHLPELLLGAESSGGNFPSPLFYVRTSGILLVLGALGFFLSLKHGRWTLWQLSVLWSLAFVLLHSVFYRRFFLQLDFFLLPFAATAMRALWYHYKESYIRAMFVIGIVLQALIMCSLMVMREPLIDAGTMSVIDGLDAVVPRDAYIISPDTDTTPFLRGWLPDRTVVGPGLFDSSWTPSQWQMFLLGTHEERQQLLQALPGDVYVFASPSFLRYYGSSADNFLRDLCFSATETNHLLRVVCK